MVLLFVTLSFVFVKTDSRKRRFLESVSNTKVFVLGQSVAYFAVMRAPQSTVFGMTFLYGSGVLFFPGKQGYFGVTYAL